MDITSMTSHMHTKRLNLSRETHPNPPYEGGDAIRTELLPSQGRLGGVLLVFACYYIYKLYIEYCYPTIIEIQPVTTFAKFCKVKIRLCCPICKVLQNKS